MEIRHQNTARNIEHNGPSRRIVRLKRSVL
jgi:hypothetical protein